MIQRKLEILIKNFKCLQKYLRENKGKKKWAIKNKNIHRVEGRLLLTKLFVFPAHLCKGNLLVIFPIFFN